MKASETAVNGTLKNLIEWIKTNMDGKEVKSYLEYQNKKNMLQRGIIIYLLNGDSICKNRHSSLGFSIWKELTGFSFLKLYNVFCDFQWYGRKKLMTNTSPEKHPNYFRRVQRQNFCEYILTVKSKPNGSKTKLPT